MTRDAPLTIDQYSRRGGPISVLMDRMRHGDPESQDILGVLHEAIPTFRVIPEPGVDDLEFRLVIALHRTSAHAYPL